MKNLKTEPQKILLLAIGNCGRGDDGLGWNFADDILKKYASLFDVEYRYQLQVEDAELVSRYQTVIFADASHNKLEKGFEWKPCKAAGHFYYSSHMQSPETILFLTNKLYNKSPLAFTFAIEGSYWKLKTTLHPTTKLTLKKALAAFESYYLPCLLKKEVVFI